MSEKKHTHDFGSIDLGPGTSAFQELRTLVSQFEIDAEYEAQVEEAEQSVEEAEQSVEVNARKPRTEEEIEDLFGSISSGRGTTAYRELQAVRHQFQCDARTAKTE